MIMENKILELLEQKGSVSMNDDIFPLVEKEFEGQVIGAELYELAHQYISQLLYGVHTAGVAVIAVPKFAAGQQFGQMVVADVIYSQVNDTPYDFMQQLRLVTVGNGSRQRLKVFIYAVCNGSNG